MQRLQSSRARRIRSLGVGGAKGARTTRPKEIAGGEDIKDIKAVQGEGEEGGEAEADVTPKAASKPSRCGPSG